MKRYIFLLTFTMQTSGLNQYTRSVSYWWYCLWFTCAVLEYNSALFTDDLLHGYWFNCVFYKYLHQGREFLIRLHMNNELLLLFCQYYRWSVPSCFLMFRMLKMFFFQSDKKLQFNILRKFFRINLTVLVFVPKHSVFWYLTLRNINVFLIKNVLYSTK